MFSCIVAKQPRAHQHSAAAAATPSCTRATTLDPSSTRTPVVVIIVQLRTARAALERTSMSRFPSMAYSAAKKNGHGTTITQLLKRNEHETNTSTAWPSSHGHTSTQQQQQQQQQHPAALEQHSTRAALVRLLLLFYCCVLLEHDELEQHELEQHCVLLLHLQQEARKPKSL